MHVAGFGKGVVREARNGGRYLVVVKGRAMVVSASALSAAPGERASARGPAPASSGGRRREAGPAAGGAPRTLDLHGKTVDEALEVLDRFLNEALLADALELRIVHGRSGGRIKAAVQRRLGEIPAVRAFRLDPANPGVTIVVL